MQQHVLSVFSHVGAVGKGSKGWRYLVLLFFTPHSAWSATWTSAHLVFDLAFLLPGHPSKFLSVTSAQHAQLSPSLFGTAGTVSE